MAFRQCMRCARGMMAVLGSEAPQWRCELCQDRQPMEDSETLVAAGRGGAAEMSKDTTLFQQYVRFMGRDSTAVKVRGWCAQCKAETIMTRAFLGVDEQVVYGCPCGASYRRLPQKPKG